MHQPTSPASDGVEKTLKVEVTTGGASRTFDLTREVGKPGAYVAPFIPTKTGSYVFRFFGKIENLDVNERFESGPNRFDEVVSKSDLQFPTQAPSNVQLAAELQKAQGDTGAGSASADVQRALDRADQARTVGLVAGGIGIVVGLIGVVLALRRPGRAPGEQDRRGEPV
jgi:hypothetical protein